MSTTGSNSSVPMFPSLARHGTRTAITLGTPLTPEGILQIVRRIADRAGLPNLRPHDLRRTFSQMCRDGGADLDMIKHSLGHASILTTERYLSQIQDLRAGHAGPDHIKIKPKKTTAVR